MLTTASGRFPSPRNQDQSPYWLLHLKIPVQKVVIWNIQCPETLSKRMSKILNALPGVICQISDVMVHGRNKKSTTNNSLMFSGALALLVSLWIRRIFFQPGQNQAPGTGGAQGRCFSRPSEDNSTHKNAGTHQHHQTKLFSRYGKPGQEIFPKSRRTHTTIMGTAQEQICLGVHTKPRKGRCQGRAHEADSPCIVQSLSRHQDLSWCVFIWNCTLLLQKDQPSWKPTASASH